MGLQNLTKIDLSRIKMLQSGYISSRQMKCPDVEERARNEYAKYRVPGNIQ